MKAVSQLTFPFMYILGSPPRKQWQAWWKGLHTLINLTKITTDKFAQAFLGGIQLATMVDYHTMWKQRWKIVFCKPRKTQQQKINK